MSKFLHGDRDADDARAIAVPRASKNSRAKNANDKLTLSQTTNFRLFQTERVCRRQFQI